MQRLTATNEASAGTAALSRKLDELVAHVRAKAMWCSRSIRSDDALMTQRVELRPGDAVKS